MYKLVFADDESVVRSKISQMIDWKSTGFSLLGCCANGYELMEIMEKELPDLIILDINMPFITGLEAARQIRGSYPQIKIIFLTGYTEFEYAKQAVELNALQFIVKPINSQELLKVLENARRVLDQERFRVRKMSELEHFYQQSRQVLLADLVRGSVDAGMLSDRAHAQGLSWNDDELFCAAVLSVDRTRHGAAWSDEDEKAMLYALYNVSAEMAEEAGIGFSYMTGDQVVLIGCSGSPLSFERRMQEFVESLLQTISGQLEFTASAGLGGVCHGCGKFPFSLSEARRALELRYREGSNQLFTVSDLQESGGCHGAVRSAVSYIESSYTDPNLSANAVCEHLHISPSYLRALFKRQTGGTIIGYITKVRMEKARVLLADDSLKNSTIAEMVGYTDPHYFSYCFRRYFSMSPAEMRDKIRQK